MPLDTELLEAVRTGGIAEVDAALARDPRQLGGRSHAYAWDPLGLALAMGKLDLAAHLLQKGADPNSWDCHDATPLAAALVLPAPLCAAALDLLARHGVRVGASDLDLALEVGNLELLAGLPRQAPREEAAEPALTPLADLPAPEPSRPADESSDLQIAAWLFAAALALIAALVLAAALFDGLGRRRPLVGPRAASAGAVGPPGWRLTPGARWAVGTAPTPGRAPARS